jgi:CBS domain-containing protein
MRRYPMLARDVMSRNVVSVRPNMPARAAAALLVVHGFTGAPVVTAEGLLRGIVTEADLMRGQPLPHLEDADTTQDTRRRCGPSTTCPTSLP